MAGEIASAYVSLYTKMPGLKSDVSKQLSGVMPTEGKRSGGLFASGMKLALGGAVMVGAINTAKKGLRSIYDVSVGGGINRVMQLDQAQAKLLGLGHSGKDVSSIMGSALASVKGTAYGLGDAATVAASLSAAGVKSGSDMTNMLKTVADTATISGRSITDIGTIFGSVAARGKLQGDDMLQLMSSGVPVLKFLSQQTGKSMSEVSKMVSDGAISFDTFAKAMKAGMGGAALQSGKTFTGALANVKAAMGRLGAAAVTAPMNGLRQVFNALIPVIDAVTAQMQPLFDAMGRGIQQAMPRITAAIAAIPAKLNTFVASARQKVAQVRDVFSRLNIKIPEINFGTVFAGVSGVLASIGGVVAAIGPKLLPISGIVGRLGGSFKGLSGVVGAAGGALRALGSPIGIVLSLLTAAYASNAQFRSAINALLPVIINLGVQIAQAIVPLIQQLLPLIVPLVSSIVAVVANVGAAIIPVVTTIVSGLTPAITGVIGFVTSHMGIFSAIAAGVGTTLGVFKAINSAVTVFSSVVGVVGGVISRVISVITGLSRAVSFVRNGFLALRFMLTGALGPFGLIIAVVAGLVAAFVVAYRHSETFRNIVNSALGAVKTAAQAVGSWFAGPFVNFFKTAWDGVTAGVSAAVDGIKSAWNGVTTFFGALVAWFQGPFAAAFTAVWNVVSAPARIAVIGITTAFNGLKAFFTGFWTVLGTIFQAGWNAIRAVVTFGVNAVKAVFTGAWNAIKMTAAAFWLGLRAIFTGNFGQLAGIVKSYTAAIRRVFTDAWNAIKSATSGFWNSLKSICSSAGSAIVAAFRSMGSGVKNAVSSGFNAAKSVGSSAVNGLKGAVSSAIHAIVGFFKSMGSGIKSATSSAFNAAKSAASNGMSSMGRAVSSGISSVVNFFKGLPGKIKGAIGNLGNTLYSVGSDLISGLVNGITSSMHRALDAVRNMGSQITNAAKSALKIHSPSRVFRDEVGAQIVNGLVAGIDGNSRLAVDAVDRLSNGLIPDSGSFTVGYNVGSSVAGFRPRSGMFGDGSRGDVVVNVNGPTYGDPNDFARRIEQKQREALTLLAYA